jgi:hypothetical protein
MQSSIGCTTSGMNSNQRLKKKKKMKEKKKKKKKKKTKQEQAPYVGNCPSSLAASLTPPPNCATSTAAKPSIAAMPAVFRSSASLVEKSPGVVRRRIGWVVRRVCRAALPPPLPLPLPVPAPVPLPLPVPVAVAVAVVAAVAEMADWLLVLRDCD